jgi:phenylacetate-CoA ligase
VTRGCAATRCWTGFGQLTGDRLYLDRYRVLLTSGSSGRPGLFVYDPAGWRSIITQMLRSSNWAGLAPSLPRQRMAFLGGVGPSHVTRQGAATLSIGLHRVLALPVTLPLPRWSRRSTGSSRPT